jgi:hypothetical protein
MCVRHRPHLQSRKQARRWPLIDRRVCCLHLLPSSQNEFGAAHAGHHDSTHEMAGTTTYTEGEVVGERPVAVGVAEVSAGCLGWAAAATCLPGCMHSCGHSYPQPMAPWRTHTH